jgi:hypothetical protein
MSQFGIIATSIVGAIVLCGSAKAHDCPPFEGVDNDQRAGETYRALDAWLAELTDENGHVDLVLNDGSQVSANVNGGKVTFKYIAANGREYAGHATIVWQDEYTLDYDGMVIDTAFLLGEAIRGTMFSSRLRNSDEDAIVIDHLVPGGTRRIALFDIIQTTREEPTFICMAVAVCVCQQTTGFCVPKDCAVDAADRQCRQQGNPNQRVPGTSCVLRPGGSKFDALWALLAGSLVFSALSARRRWQLRGK